VTERSRRRLLVLAFAVWICYTITLSIVKMPEDKHISQWHLDVVFHYSSYLVMALLGVSLVSWWALLPALAIAGGTELLQGALPHRTASWADFGVNVAGITTGLLLWWIVGKLRKRKRLRD
jgi:membrane associated rhomboid family serine protease